MLLALNFSSILSLAGVGIICLGVGLLYKSAVVAKQRKRILRLEDEMLTNHASILELEKKLAEALKDKPGVKHDFNLTSVKQDREVKAS